MKTKILFSFFLISGLLTMESQTISDNSIGLRLGDSDGFGTEVSYQRALGSNNRLEANLGWRSGNNFDGFKLAGIYQWLWNLDGNFNWYAGVGGGIGSYDFDAPLNLSETFVFASGNLGIEYIFEIPLLLSLDFRPEFGFGDFNDDLDFDIALGIRYQF